MASRELVKLSVDTIRTLSIDGVQKANSGHPGAPMALAPAAYVLWMNIMKYNPDQPQWIDRDRFILSNGHASMLLYSMLYLTGYDVSLEDLKNFRQWGSKTPGHPEHGHTAGVETTTGPLGQGFMTGVGMAMAEAHLASKFNQPNHDIIDHYTYCICSDGDLMEGASHEAASLAGHLGLGKMIYLYDDNHITIEGDTDLTFTEDVEMRFNAYGWHVINLGESSNDLEKIEAAYDAAKKETDKPTLIILRTHIGYGSPNFQDTGSVHGSPLGEEEIKLTKEAYGYPSLEPFFVSEDVRAHMLSRKATGKKSYENWVGKYDAFKGAFPKVAEEMQNALDLALPKDWETKLPTFVPADGPMATRAVNSKVLNAIADDLPWLMGGSADLEPSTKTALKGKAHFSKSDYSGRNIAWGIREMAMCAACSGMSLHGGIKPYGATFFVFTDYARGAIRLAALMNLPVIYVMTHDSIGLGEDGPTHQPIEHLASLRAMPNLLVIRPADANETVISWKIALERKNSPTMLVLSRQGIPILDRNKHASSEGVARGAYIVSRENGSSPDVILMSTGSEVAIAIEAKEKLAALKIDARVVSMPCWELFDEQDDSYREEVIPNAIRARISIEAGSTFGWHRWVGDQGVAIGIDHFGASAPYKTSYKEFGLTSDDIVSHAKSILA